MARRRNAPSMQLAAPKSMGRQPLKEKTNTTRAKAPAYEDDGNIEHLVKDSKPKRGRSKKAQQSSDELVMAGGLGMAGSEDAPHTSEAPTTTDELAKSDDVPPPNARPNKRPPRMAKKIVQNEKQSKVLEGLKQRMEATARGQKTTGIKATVSPDPATFSSGPVVASAQASQSAKDLITESSELRLSPSPQPLGKLSVGTGKRTSIAQPGSVFRAQATPAIERSLLALKNFKRRPRQPSMLQMVQQRTASARPSMTNTVVEPTDVKITSGFDLDLTADEDDFVPEAEGTPLHAAKPKRISSASSKRILSPARPTHTSHDSASAAKKRKSDEVHHSSSSLARLRAKRRKSTTADEEEVEDRLPQQTIAVFASQSSSERPETPSLPMISDVQVLNSPSTSTPPTEPPSPQQSLGSKDGEFIILSTERESGETRPALHNEVPDEDVGLNGTMADPLSSSPLRESASQGYHLAYPATQPSPVAPKAMPKKKTKPVSTAVLQSLLPKKRAPLKPRHRKSEYDVESDSDEDAPLDASHLDEDEDELGGRLRRRTKQIPTKASKKTGGKSGRSTKPSRAAGQYSAAPLPASNTAATTRKGPRTYGRAAGSDKENDDYDSASDEHDESTLPEISVSMAEVAKSKELEEAKRRFAEVDQWEMEFESISSDNHRSSSQGWR